MRITLSAIKWQQRQVNASAPSEALAALQPQDREKASAMIDISGFGLNGAFEIELTLEERAQAEALAASIITRAGHTSLTGGALRAKAASG